jgi:isopropylmalate/homocitrate/citramalate synthase
LEALGYNVSPNEIDEFHHRFLALADEIKQVSDEDLVTLMAR